MIIGAALFLCAVGVLAAAAAWTAEEGLRRAGVPTRGIWLAAMASGPALLIGPAALPDAATGWLGVPAVAPLFELPPLTLGPTQVSFVALDLALGGVWILLSLAMLGLLFRTQRGLSRERAGWTRADVQGRSVYVSPDRGPAVAGTIRPWIVLPRWALTMPDVDLGLVVLHEEEHVRAKDSLLLGAALMLVVATPWNPLTWWQFRRLRGAMEMDCDRRVLRREPDRERYGRALLFVARRASGPSLGLAAFTERWLSLERRIVAMTSTSSRWAPVRAAFFVILASVIGVQACGVESPVVSNGPEAAVVEAQAASGDVSASSFGDQSVAESDSWKTPYTVQPSILNRQEVVEAMNEEYPPLLRDAGIGGTIRVYFFITETGDLQDYRIQESSGHQALDDAALRVATKFRFSPALNGAEPIAVWIQMPITFQPR